MATLILSAAGAAVGGPIGSAVGTFLGRQVDRSLARRPQSRLTDWRAPSSRYGEPIPATLGRMRVAGVVLWAGPPVVTTTISKNGSGQGLSVSFAYGLSSGPIKAVHRIWADGRLIRDEQGRQDVTFELRLHQGDEDQASDPLIASILGEELAPAYRGIAYLVFENFDLSSFGNRLPLLTVEVVGDAGPLAAEEVCRQALRLTGEIGGSAHELEGVALVGDDKAEAMSPLCEAFSTTFGYDGTHWSIEDAPAYHAIEEQFWIGNDVDAAFRVAPVGDLPTKVSLRFFDPEIDFAAGEKSARLPGPERLRRVEIPAALGGDRAKAVAAELLTEWTNEGSELWLQLPLTHARIQLGDEVGQAAEGTKRFRVCEKRIEGTSVTLRIERARPVISSLTSDSGGVIGARLFKRSPLSIVMIELPGDMFDSDLKVGILSAGGHSPYQPLPVVVSSAGDEQQMSTALVAAPMGELMEALEPAPGLTFDRRNSLFIKFAWDPLLTSCNEDALLQGANLLRIGDEFLQFATASLVGDSTYRLSEFLRGRFDSEVKAEHPTGTRVALLDPAAMTTLKVPPDRIGSTMTARVLGPDGIEEVTSLRLIGLGIRPWKPAHVTTTQGQEGLSLSWVRCCKEGGPWLDGVDAPIGASREAYDVLLSDASGKSLQMQVTDTKALFADEELRVLGARPWRLEVRQLGDFVASEPRICFID